MKKSVHRAQNENQRSSAQRRLCSAVSFLRGRLILATSSELHIRPGRAGVKYTLIKDSKTVERGESCNCAPKMRSAQRDHGYLACDCIVSLQSIEGPFDVLTTEHPEIRHEQVGSLHHSLGSHRAQLGIVKQVLGHLKRPRTDA